MNAVKLKVKNFGPIKEGYENDDGYMSFPKVTLFCGPQGSGKSTITKLVSSLMWLEKAAYVASWSKPNFSIEDPSFLNPLFAWHNLETYLQSNTEISYQGDGISIHYDKGKLLIKPRVSEGDLYQKPKIMYLPAERNFLHYFKNSAPVSQSPLLALFSEYDRAQKAFSSGYDLPVNGYRFAVDQAMGPVIVNTHANGGEAKTPVGAASSGLQSIVPLLLVTDYLKSRVGQDASKTFNNESLVVIDNPFVSVRIDQEEPFLTGTDDRLDVPAFLFRSKQGTSGLVNVVEEPEQNLFPPTQRNVLRKLIAVTNGVPHSRLVLSSHSPYVVSDLVAATRAHILYDKAKGLGSEKTEFLKQIRAAYAEDSAIPSSEVCLYETGYEGKIIRMMDGKGRLKDANYLNQHLKLSAMLFDHLFALEHAMDSAREESQVLRDRTDDHG